MPFQFVHPDPDKIVRLEERWAKGFQWSEDDVREYKVLVEEWARFNVFMENHEALRRLRRDAERIFQQIAEQRPVRTERGAYFVRPRTKARARPTTI